MESLKEIFAKQREKSFLLHLNLKLEMQIIFLKDCTVARHSAYCSLLRTFAGMLCQGRLKM